jgi:hypothetical protein
MPSPAQLTQLLVEFVFLLLGALLVFLGITHHINFVPGGTPWLVISVALLAWGLLAFAKSGASWLRWQKWVRGSSLVLLGVIMLSMMRVPFLWVSKLLVVAGFVLVARGLAGMLLILRQR